MALKCSHCIHAVCSRASIYDSSTCTRVGTQTLIGRDFCHSILGIQFTDRQRKSHKRDYGSNLIGRKAIRKAGKSGMRTSDVQDAVLILPNIDWIGKAQPLHVPPLWQMFPLESCRSTRRRDDHGCIHSRNATDNTEAV